MPLPPPRGRNRFRSFFKNLFKSIHIAEVLKDREGNTKTEPDKAKVRYMGVRQIHALLL